LTRTSERTTNVSAIVLATGVRVSTLVDVDAFSGWFFVEVFVAVVAVAFVSTGVVLAFAV